MAVALYVMPIIGTGATRQDPRRPKYKDSLFPTLVWGMFDYGDEPQCLVGIVDVPPATDTQLQAQSDVFALPANLDQTVSATNTRNQIRTRLEQSELPGTWVQTTTTYREIVRVVGACCQIAQRYQGLTGGRWFSGTVHITSTFGSLTVTQRQGIIAAAQSFGFSTAAIIDSATIRDVLKGLADQYLASGQPLNLAGASL